MCFKFYVFLYSCISPDTCVWMDIHDGNFWRKDRDKDTFVSCDSQGRILRWHLIAIATGHETETMIELKIVH